MEELKENQGICIGRWGFQEVRDVEQCCTRTSCGRLSQMTQCGVFTSVFSLVYSFCSLFSWHLSLSILLLPTFLIKKPILVCIFPLSNHFLILWNLDAAYTAMDTVYFGQGQIKKYSVGYFWMFLTLDIVDYHISLLQWL